MTIFRLGILFFLVSSQLHAGNVETHLSNQEKEKKELVAKIYSLLIPSELKRSEKSAQIYPGKLYDVGGYRLHMFCTGDSKNGSPTILIESGAGGFSSDWIPIQLELSKRVRVCAYDRVGYGWSEEWSTLKNIQQLKNILPRTIDDHVKDLDRLLKQSDIRTPIVLMAHSYGGPISLAFEGQYSDLVKGLVLLDPHDDGAPMKDDLYTQEIADSLKWLEKEKSPAGLEKWEAKLKEISQHIVSYEKKENQPQVLIEDLWILIQALDRLKWTRANWSEWRALHKSCAKVKEHPSPSLRNKVLAVITSDPSHLRSEGQTYLHMQTAKQSTLGRVYFAMGSSHNIPGERPDLVIRVVNQVLNSIEGKTLTSLKEEQLPQLKGPLRFFVDGELAEYVRIHEGKKESNSNLNKFCQNLGFGFKKQNGFGYFSRNGLKGYSVLCE